MFAKLLGPSARLEIQFEQQAVFVYPTALAPSSAHESALRGIVKLRLPERRRISSLCVVLQGVRTRGLNPMGGQKLKGSAEVIKHETAHLDVGEVELESGEHEFPFEFGIPASTECSGPTRFGHTGHSVTALLEFASGRPSAMSSPGLRFWVVPMRHEPGEVPDPFDISYEHNSAELGPMRLHIFSPQLTLGALLHLKLFVASPPAAVTVSSVRATLVSTHVLCPPAADIADIEVPVAHVAGTGPSPTVSDFDGTSKTLTTREEWTYRGIFAMPLCYPDGAAPSTLEGSDHYIRISHKLAIQVRYSTGSETSTKATTISIPVTVDSCVSLAESLRLPPYTEAPPETEVRYSPYGTLCACEFDLSERLEKCRDVLEAAGNQALEPEGERSVGVSVKDEVRGVA